MHTTSMRNGGSPPRSDQDDLRPQLEATRATCRRQAVVIDTLTDAVSILRRGTTALKAENAELRAENERIRGAGTSANGRATPGKRARRSR